MNKKSNIRLFKCIAHDLPQRLKLISESTGDLQYSHESN